MTDSRRAELETMLQTRLHAIQEQMQQKIRTFRDTASVDAARPVVDVSDDPVPEDIDFSLVQMQAQTRAHIAAALARLEAGEYGVCDECEEEIPEKRLRALPFATRCLPCQEGAERVELRERRLGRRDFRARPADGTGY